MILWLSNDDELKMQKYNSPTHFGCVAFQWPVIVSSESRIQLITVGPWILYPILHLKTTTEPFRYPDSCVGVINRSEETKSGQRMARKKWGV